MNKCNIICGSIAAVLFLLGAGLLTAGLVVEFSAFPKIIKKNVADGKVLGQNSDGTLNTFTGQWKNEAYISTMYYYMFNYTNTISLMNRAIYPDVMEKGPYAYTEVIRNDDVNFSPNGEQMNFTKKIQYIFNKDLSCPDCDPYNDTVIVPDISFFLAMDFIEAAVQEFRQNPLLNGICQKLGKEDMCKNIGNIIEKELGTLMDVFNTGPFVQVTVDQLLFSGYEAPIATNVVEGFLNFLNTLAGVNHFHFNASMIPPIMLNSENGTTDFLYTVNTGKSNYQLSGYIDSFVDLADAKLNSVGQTLPSAWWPAANTGNCTGHSAEPALRIDGTNADYFKSYIEKDEQLPIYVEGLYRTVYLTYDREVEVKGIKGYRFVLPASQFNWEDPNNCGFCNPLQFGYYDRPQNSSCLPSGLLDITAGSGGAPIIISKPHFYEAAPVAQQFIPRFRPNYDNDETVIDIEPITGTVLSAKKKLQINMLVNQMPHIGAYSVLRPGAYPLVWLNESYLMDDGTQNDLQTQLFDNIKLVNILCNTFIGVGALLMVIAVLMIFIRCFVERRKSKQEVMKKK